MLQPTRSAILTGNTFRIKKVKDYPVHKLSHQHIYARLFDLEITGKPTGALARTFIEVNNDETNNYPVSRLMEKILDDHL